MGAPGKTSKLALANEEFPPTASGLISDNFRNPKMGGAIRRRYVFEFSEPLGLYNECSGGILVAVIGCLWALFSAISTIGK